MTLVFSCQAWFYTQYILELLVISAIGGFAFANAIGSKLDDEPSSEKPRDNRFVTYMLRVLVIFALTIGVIAGLRTFGVIHVVGFFKRDPTSNNPTSMIDQICKGHEHD